MSAATAQPPSASLEVVRSDAVVSADQWNERRIAFVRQNFGNDAPDPEFDAFIHICKRRGLAPEEKQIYLIPRGKKWTVQTSIDGYRLIAERTQLYAGSDEAVFEESGDRLLDGKGKAYPLKATVTVWKIVAGVRSPFTASAYWEEYNGGTDLWLKMPHVMLAKCAESQALRKAFPADLSGIYTIEEMDQADRDDRPTPKAKAKESSPADTLEGAMKAVHAKAKEQGVSHDRLHDLAVAAYGVPSLSDCDVRQLTGIRCVVRDCSAEQFEAVTVAAQSIDTSTDLAFLDDIAQQIAAGDLPDLAKRLLKKTIERVGERVRGGSRAGDVQDAEFRVMDEAPAEPDEDRLIWQNRVDAGFAISDEKLRAKDLEAAIAEAGDDGWMWEVLLSRATDLSVLRWIRGKHLQSPAKTNQACVDAYNRRQAQLQSAAKAS